MRNKFTSSLAGAVFSFAASGLAVAADMPVKAPPPPAPAPVYNWTGFYVGLNVGYGWADPSTDIAATETFLSGVGVFGGPGFPSTASFADSNKARLEGVVG